MGWIMFPLSEKPEAPWQKKTVDFTCIPAAKQKEILNEARRHGFSGAPRETCLVGAIHNSAILCGWGET